MSYSCLIRAETQKAYNDAITDIGVGTFLGVSVIKLVDAEPQASDKLRFIVAIDSNPAQLVHACGLNHESYAYIGHLRTDNKTDAELKEIQSPLATSELYDRAYTKGEADAVK